MSEETEGRCKMVAKENESEQVSEVRVEDDASEQGIKSLSAEAIMRSSDNEMQELHIAQWGGSIYVRGVTCAERDELDKLLNGKAPDVSKARLRIVTRCCCDADGNQLFSVEDEAWLAKKSNRIIEAINELAMRLSGIGANEEESSAADFPRGQSGAYGSS